MQITLLSRRGTGLQLPTELSSVMINPEVHSTRLWDWSANEKGNRYIFLHMVTPDKKVNGFWLDDRNSFLAHQIAVVKYCVLPWVRNVFSPKASILLTFVV